MTAVRSDLARYTVRTQPWGLLTAGWAVAALIGVVAHVDSELELMSVTLAATIGVGSALPDPAGTFTETAPERRSSRRARSVAPAATGSLLVWLAVTAGTAAWFDSTPAPGSAAFVVWLTVTFAQVAVGSLLARRSDRDPGIGPAALVGAAFLTPFVVPGLHGWLNPVSEHGARWAGLILAAIATTAWAWRDPGAPREVNPIGR